MSVAKPDQHAWYSIPRRSRRRLLGAAAGLAAAMLGVLSPLPRPAGAAQPAPRDAIPFAVFLAKMDIVSSVQAFDMRGPLVFGAGGRIDLASDDVTVQLSNQTHTASITIPKGSFEKEDDWYVYYGAIGGCEEQEHLPDQRRRDHRGRASGIPGRGDFHEVHADDPVAPEAPQRHEQFRVGGAVRFGVPRPRGHGRIEHVDVDGQVERPLPQGLQQGRRRLDRARDVQAALPRNRKLLPRPRAGPQLDERDPFI